MNQPVPVDEIFGCAPPAMPFDADADGVCPVCLRDSCDEHSIDKPTAVIRTAVAVVVPGLPSDGLEDAVDVAAEGRALADVQLPPMPEYYRHTLENGKTVMETAPTIQWGYLIYLTVLRLCQYFGAKEECQFCDINHNWRQHKREGRPYTGVKPIEDVLEALALIDQIIGVHTN